MKAKETRGRRKKYDFTLKKGQLKTMPFSDGARTTALRYAREAGLKYRTWVENDILNVLRVACLLIFLTACKHEPEFVINGIGYYTNTHCVQDSSWTVYEYHYGLGYNGKMGFHYGPKAHWKCLITKTDTIQVER